MNTGSIRAGQMYVGSRCDVRLLPSPSGDFQKLGVPLFGVPMMILALVLIWGPPLPEFEIESVRLKESFGLLEHN